MLIEIKIAIDTTDQSYTVDVRGNETPVFSSVGNYDPVCYNWGSLAQLAAAAVLKGTINGGSDNA